jgi:ketosteroid isomerase-like protein
VSESAEGVQIVRSFLEPIFAGQESDVALLLEDRERIDRVIHPEAETTFEVPYTTGAMGDLAGPWRGPDGFLAGWREWLKVWSEFKFADPRPVEAPDGRVLLLVECVGTMRETGVSVRQPAGAVYAFEDGQIRHIRQFLDHDQARAAAGLA